ncbi:hypothetical protein GQ55_9G013700 [Panicum hallii var. hallii]|uniref:Uncharacterized protein n=1 Tax=Panicum hallii var. hallii TaxID=1504633 RepID=A0A2T7BYQ5_9POAL|nr:hypothetical protein GQ55_9G013700 [Panicum hallii var. hallii]
MKEAVPNSGDGDGGERSWFLAAPAGQRKLPLARASLLRGNSGAKPPLAGAGARTDDEDWGWEWRREPDAVGDTGAKIRRRRSGSMSATMRQSPEPDAVGEGEPGGRYGGGTILKTCSGFCVNIRIAIRFRGYYVNILGGFMSIIWIFLKNKVGNRRWRRPWPSPSPRIHLRARAAFGVMPRQPGYTQRPSARTGTTMNFNFPAGSGRVWFSFQKAEAELKS